MDIEARIEQLKAQIAEKEAYQKKLQESYSNPYNKHSYANMWDYVVEGNRAGYDREDAEAAAYQKLLMEQAQADKLQKDQMLNALSIAQHNKATELETKKDEYIRGRNKAASVLDYAQQTLAQDPNNIQLQKEVKLAKEDFDFYDRKLGGQGYDNIAVQTEQPTEGLNNNQVNSIVKSIVVKKEYTDADRNKLKVLKEYVTDQTIKEQIDTVISNKKATKEDKDRDKANKEAFAKNWKPGQPFDNKIYKQKFKNGKPYLAVR